MRQLLLTSILACVCAVFIQAQVPQLISYQAVARDLTGKVLSEKPISVQVEILQGSSQGTAVYTETHALTTTKTGTINLLIGGGNAQAGTFAEIDWSKAPYFLRLGMKQKKETEYTEVSNTQMVSVPYALYAEKAGSVVNNGGNTGEATGSMVDFIIVPEEGYPDYYGILAGKEATSGHFKIDIIYLDGKDQNVEMAMEGIPAEYLEIDMSPSSNNGCHMNIHWNEVPAGSYDMTLTFKNNRGFTREYKFTYIKEER